MQLSEQHRASLRRLFSDESLIDAIRAVAEDATNDYRDRAYRAAYGAHPDIVEISQYACKGVAFESIVPLLQAEAQITEESDVDQD